MKIFCIIGDERAFRSKSPGIFTTVMKRVGIRGAYVPFKVQRNQIGPAMQSLKILNMDGANVTVPYKEAVIPHMDILSEGANIVGAVNTIVVTGEKLKGYNTNAIGFMDALAEVEFEVAGKRAVIFGTGGAAKAVAFILNWLRAENIIVAGRSVSKTNSVIERISGEARAIDDLVKQPLSADIVVNATSVSSPDESAGMAALVERLDVRDCELIVDINYGRRQNFWENLARNRDIRFMDGLSTLVHQARRSFLLWTRIDVEPSEFRKALAEDME